MGLVWWPTSGYTLLGDLPTEWDWAMHCRRAFHGTVSGLPLHDRGKVLVQSCLMLAGGGESCADIEHLRLQEDLFASVPSDTTVFRTFHEMTPSTEDGDRQGMAEVRAEVWRRSGATTGNAPVLLDIDASLVDIHSEHKVDAAPTFKGGYRLPSDVLLRRRDRRSASGLLRAGNAGANTVADHVSVLDAAVGQLPEEIARRSSRR